jgi:hypothetical protein
MYPFHLYIFPYHEALATWWLDSATVTFGITLLYRIPHNVDDFFDYYDDDDDY